MDLQNTWVVECHERGALRVRPAADMIEANRLHFEKRETPSGFVPIGLFENMDLAREFEREIKRMRHG